MNILVLGASGMLGSTTFKLLRQNSALEVWGSLRSLELAVHFSESDRSRLIAGIDVLNHGILVDLIERIRPEVIVNCVGLIKQVGAANDPLAILPINAMLPHRLARLCASVGARLIHVSTDCVFSGRKGGYTEADVSDAEDLYGKSKYIGELHDLPHVVTLRTSIIGHEIGSSYALVDWFLSQQGSVRGFSRAIFSGLPTVELARVMMDSVLPRPELHGLYHVAAAPITKLDLLRLVAGQYGKAIDIQPDDSLMIDRSLNGSRFREATGYLAPEWPELVRRMHAGR